MKSTLKTNSGDFIVIYSKYNYNFYTN